MTVKRVFYAALALLLALVVAIVVWQYQVIVEPLLRKSAQDAVLADARMAATAMLGQYDQLTRLTAELAQADARAVVRYEQPSFYGSNRLAALALIDAGGKIVLGYWYGGNAGGLTRLPPEIVNALAVGLPKPDAGSGRARGLVMVAEKPVQLVAFPFSGSADGGGGAVRVVVGQLADAALGGLPLQDLRLRIEEVPFAPGKVPAALLERQYDFSARDFAIVEYGDAAAGTAAAAVVWADVGGQPCLALLPQPAEGGGVKPLEASWLFQAVLILCVLGFGVVALLVAELVLFKPIAGFQQSLDALISRKDGVSVQGAGAGLFAEMSASVTRLVADYRANDAALREKESILLYRFKVEEALARVARILLRNSSKGVANSLRILGNNFNADVVSFWQIAPGGDSMRCIGTFREEESGEFSGDYDFVAPVAGWIENAIRLGQNLVIDDVDKIPPESASVKVFISEYELKSFLGVPLSVPGRQFGGLVAFGNIRSARHWSKEDLRALEVVAELLVDRMGRGGWQADGAAPEEHAPDRV